MLAKLRIGVLLTTLVVMILLGVGTKLILDRVWDARGVGYDPNTVEVYVGYLRRKLGAGVIETVRGAGYRLWRAWRWLCPSGDCRERAAHPPGRTRHPPILRRGRHDAA